MPIFTRFCPVNWQTCARRECQGLADCQYPPQLPKDPQKAWDVLHPPSPPNPDYEDFSCFDDPVDGPVDRVFQRFLDVLTGVRSSAECPTLEELQL